MRAFLREPSTPWIVFDQETRPVSQLSVGEVLEVPRKMLLSDPSFFTATAAIDAAAAEAAAKQNEPSSLAVASDLMDDEDVHTSARPLALATSTIEAPPIPMRGVSRRVIGASIGAFALVATLSIGAFAVRSSINDGGDGSKHAAAAQPGGRSVGAAVPAEIPPPDLDVKAPAPPPASPDIAVNAATAPTPSPANDTPALSNARRYGRLSVVGDARGKDVFMDGKRMLGRGARSFTVLCGTHTIAVGTRTDAHEVDLPCTGSAELLIGK